MVSGCVRFQPPFSKIPGSTREDKAYNYHHSLFCSVLCRMKCKVTNRKLRDCAMIWTIQSSMLFSLPRY